MKGDEGRKEGGNWKEGGDWKEEIGRYWEEGINWKEGRKEGKEPPAADRWCAGECACCWFRPPPVLQERVLSSCKEGSEVKEGRKEGRK
jgi:hypothetical protein